MDSDKLPIIIAEAGVNHNGSLTEAKKLVDIAVSAGADYVKFQTFKAEKLTVTNCPTAEYQKKTTGDSAQMEMLKKLELSYPEFIELREYCHKKGIGFLSTPFDLESIEFLASLNLDFMKVPSGEITNLPYLRKIAETHIPVIISTGMATMDEIADCLVPFREQGYDEKNIILLHCNTQYPTPYNDVNLNAMQTMNRYFGLPVGYSDHTRGLEVPVAATALGAVVIEKHFTSSRLAEGPDHAASLEPDELAEMVRMIRNVELALGNSKKVRTESEKGNVNIARKSIVAAKKIKKGEIIEEQSLICKRPGMGLSPMLWDKVVGTIAIKDFDPDDFIEI